MSLHDSDDLRHAFEVAQALASEHHCLMCALEARFGKEGVTSVLADVAVSAAEAAGVSNQAAKKRKVERALVAAVAYGVLAGMAVEP